MEIGEITRLLRMASTGDSAATELLYRQLYPELTRLARAHLARAGTISLDAPALLNETYLRLSAPSRLPDASRRFFFAYASKVMRSVIVDYLRERGARKRGDGVPDITLGKVGADTALTRNSLNDVEHALEALECVDARACRVVEMRYFGGLTESEIACVLEISLPTVKRDWRKARAFLYEQLRD